MPDCSFGSMKIFKSGSAFGSLLISVSKPFTVGDTPQSEQFRPSFRGLNLNWSTPNRRMQGDEGVHRR
jgi:hypothetical protein